MRKITAFASAAAVAVAGLVVLPFATADEVTTTSSIPLTCKATPSTSLAGPQNFSADSVSVKIRAPESVDVGQNFTTTFSIDPVSINLPSLPMNAKLIEASRLKLDLALPDGVSFVGATVDESNANLKGFKVLQVNDAGSPDPAGRILRLASADNATIGNGPNASRNSAGGVTYQISGSTLDFNFPKISLDLRADQEGDKAFGVRTAGNAGNFGADENFLTLLPKTSPIFIAGTVWAPTQCSPRANENAAIDPAATAMATVKVNPEETGAPTTTTLDAVTGAIAGTPTALTATVDPAVEGTVTFTSGELKSDPVPITDGRATGELTFPESGDYEVTASFTPANAGEHAASSAQRTVTVAGQSANLAVTAAESAPAKGTVDATATVDPGATGTVSFSIGDGGEVTAAVVDGRATASVPTGTAVGAQTLTATYLPATGSSFGTETVTAPIEITAITDTGLALDGIGEPIHPGETATIIAMVTPAENTDAAAGQVIFTVDGRESTVEVADNKATLDFTPDQGGDVAVSARFVPADDTQSPAEATGTLKVITAGDTVLSAQAPTGVEPMVEAPTTVTVSPAAAGTVTATVDGRKISATVADGTATLPLVFPRAGEFTVPVKFTPADPRAARAAETSITVTVASPKFDSATVAISGPAQGTFGEKQVFRANITPNVGSAANVSGYLTLASNGTKVTKDGAEVRIPVVRGVADFDLTWSDAGRYTLSATFHDAEAQVLGTGTHGIGIADENGNVPGAGGENPDTGGSLTGSSGWTDIKSFFDRLWKFIVDLFTGKLTPGSLGSSNGAPAGSTGGRAPSASSVQPSAPASPAPAAPSAPADGAQATPAAPAAPAPATAATDADAANGTTAPATESATSAN